MDELAFRTAARRVTGLFVTDRRSLPAVMTEMRWPQKRAEAVLGRLVAEGILRRPVRLAAGGAARSNQC